ncbi:hypothetical protein H0H93_016946 [Arthromyces matolae]|nr:hypothetical protein H0H93_016946 [Arthromyces matolae]
MSVLALSIWYIQFSIFEFSTLREVRSLGDTCKDLRINAEKHTRHRLMAPFKRYPFDIKTLLQFLEKNDSVVFGSTVTSVLLPLTDVVSDLDICAPFHKVASIVPTVERFMSSRAHNISQQYTRTLFRNVYSVGVDGCRIKIFVAPSRNVLQTIFNSPTTSLMNYMTGSRLYCAYPDLTFDGTFMLNIGMLFHEDPDFDPNHFAEMVAKVQAHGLRLVFKAAHDDEVCGEARHCPLTWRGYKERDAWQMTVPPDSQGQRLFLNWRARNTRWCLQAGCRD